MLITNKRQRVLEKIRKANAKRKRFLQSQQEKEARQELRTPYPFHG